MDFVLFKGKDFSEHFDFKNDKGKSIALPSGDYKVVLERGTFAREYRIDSGLSKNRTQITWTIPGEDNKDFAYSVLYYTLYMNNQELARGILRIQ